MRALICFYLGFDEHFTESEVGFYIIDHEEYCFYSLPYSEALKDSAHSVTRTVSFATAPPPPIIHF